MKNKTEVYLDALQFLTELLTLGDVLEDTAPLTKRYFNVGANLYLLGSDSVIKAYQVWLGSSRNGKDYKATLMLFGELIKAMRKDFNPKSTASVMDLIGMLNIDMEN